MDRYQENVQKENIVAPEQKFQLLVKVSNLISRNSNIAISGSISNMIAERQVEGGCSLGPEDMTRINDIDLVSTLFNKNEAIEKLVDENPGTGFEIEASSLFLAAAYSKQLYPKIIKEVNLQLGQISYPVHYTSVEFLLLTLVNQSVSDKTSPEKYRRKIMSLTNSPALNMETFRELANYEIHSTHEMNRDTFNRWVGIFKEKLQESNLSLEDSLEKEFNSGFIPTTIDSSRLKNIIRSADDLSDLGYDEVRNMTKLEIFLKELEAEEVE